MEQFVIHVPDKKISRVRQFLAELNIQIKPVSGERAGAGPIAEDTASNDIGGLTAVGFDAWASDWKDDAEENKVWEEFYKNQQHGVSAR